MSVINSESYKQPNYVTVSTKQTFLRSHNVYDHVGRGGCDIHRWRVETGSHGRVSYVLYVLVQCSHIQ